MKRSPLNRKTPLRRTGRLKRRSRKRAREDRAVNDLAEFAALFRGTPCWKYPHLRGTEIDHIFQRNHRKRHHRTNLFWCSRRAHEEKSSLNRAEWIQLKKDNDPDGWDEATAIELSKGKNGRIDV